MNNKKGISEVIVWVIGIALVLVAIGVVWAVAARFIGGQTEKFGACSDLTGKINLNRKFTCLPPRHDWPIASVSLGDIDIDGFYFILENDAGQTKRFEILKVNGGKIIENIGNYRSIGDKEDSKPFNDNINFPKQNEGATYIFDANSLQEVSNIKLGATVGGQDCGIVDSIDLSECSTSIVKAAGETFKLGCEIITTDVPGEINLNTQENKALNISFRYYGNPTHYQFALGSNIKDRPDGRSDEVELCRVAAHYPSWSKIDEKIPYPDENDDNTYALSCSWKDAWDSTASKYKSAFNTTNYLEEGDAFAVTLIVYHKNPSDPAEKNTAIVDCDTGDTPITEVTYRFGETPDPL